MQRYQSKLPSASTHALGVLGRLMRAFPARAVAETEIVADAVQQSRPVVARKPISTSTGPQGLLTLIENWIWRQQQQERDRYLAAATDRADLEARMRVLEMREARDYRPF